MSKTIDNKKLSETIKAKRGNYGLRAAATQIGGMSASTLSRIEQGNLPDIGSFIAICRWLGVSPDYFTVKEKDEVASGKKQVIAHLRADRTLPKETSEALIQMINLAYDSASKKRNKK
ncbi:MAG: helix-turn-helix domain-containing protein [Chitinophagaceae bacterium]|jgi:transcriptional regulator with XRE-family HTH domain|nr:helix-turn-helix domain-containing protein [Chitinophagaceae bacterium]